MSLCDQFEQEIDYNQNHIEDLMQSCLREVLEPFKNKAESSELMMATEP